MFARRLPSILPPLAFSEALKPSELYCLCGRLPLGEALLSHRPVRGPRHSTSDAGLIGGSIPRRRTVSLAPVSSTAVRKELRSSDENSQDRRRTTAMDTRDSNLAHTPFDDGELYDDLLGDLPYGREN